MSDHGAGVVVWVLLRARGRVCCRSVGPVEGLLGTRVACLATLVAASPRSGRLRPARGLDGHRVWGAPSGFYWRAAPGRQGAALRGLCPRSLGISRIARLGNTPPLAVAFMRVQRVSLNTNASHLKKKFSIEPTYHLTPSPHHVTPSPNRAIR